MTIYWFIFWITMAFVAGIVSTVVVIGLLNINDPRTRTECEWEEREKEHLEERREERAEFLRELARARGRKC